MEDHFFYKSAKLEKLKLGKFEWAKTPLHLMKVAKKIGAISTVRSSTRS